MRGPVIMSMALLLTLITGCIDHGRSGTTPADAIGTAFRGRWWHYYRRGVNRARAGFHDQAEADLRTTLRLRHGDSRRGRTYGMHFIHCFPHRELGACLLAQGRVAEAAAELRLSMAQEPSAKAAWLLERCRHETADDPAADDGALVALDDAGATTAATDTGAAVAVPRADALSLDRVTALGAEVADGLAVAGRFLGELGRDLWVVDGGRARPVPLAADGSFTVTVPAGARLASGPAAEALAASDQTVVDEDGAAPPTDAAAVEAHATDVDFLPLLTPALPPPAPVLELSGPDDGAVLRGDRVWYRYRARAGAGLARLVVTGTGAAAPMTVAVTGIEQGGVVAVPLAPGAHELVFTLVDATGTEAVVHRDLTIHPAVQTARRYRAPALLAPLHAPVDSAPLAAGDDDYYGHALVQAGRFRYLDRRADAALERELALVEGGYVDRLTAADAGRRLQARYVVTGTLRRGAGDVECYLRLVHAASGRVVATADAYAAGDAARDDNFFRAVAARLHQVFPILQAEGVQRETGAWRLDVGARDGLRPGRLFYIVEQEADLIDADTGEVILPGEERVVGRVEVVDVETARSEARVVDPAPAVAVPARMVSE